jgi:hypothetical protein
VLVINGHKQEWLEPLQSALVQALKPVVKTWALPATSVAVLNHELAQQHGMLNEQQLEDLCIGWFQETGWRLFMGRTSRPTAQTRSAPITGR